MLNHVATRRGEDARELTSGPARRAKACGSCHRHFTVQPYMDVADLPAQFGPAGGREAASLDRRTDPTRACGVAADCPLNVLRQPAELITNGEGYEVGGPRDGSSETTWNGANASYTGRNGSTLDTGAAAT
jgi:hypothetical protein